MLLVVAVAMMVTNVKKFLFSGSTIVCLVFTLSVTQCARLHEAGGDEADCVLIDDCPPLRLLMTNMENVRNKTSEQVESILK